MEKKTIGTEEVLKMTEILERYKEGKRALEQRIIEAEEFWKLRHWRSIREKRQDEPEPASGWLVNVILSKHSDAVDAYPEPVCLAREEGDKAEAMSLSSILPVILQQNDFEQVWSDVWWYKLKAGTGCYGAFWDPSALGGMGDVAIRKVDLLNLFWEPGISDLQASRYVFHVALEDNEALEEQWPQLKDQLQGSRGPTISRYIYDEAISTEGKSLVVDAYYKKNGLLHLCKFVGDTVLFATENQPEQYPSGLYDHGKYPFVLDPLFPEEGYPGCGYGYVDLCRDPQKIIDLLDNAFVQSALASSYPRWLVRMDGGINEAEYMDFRKKLVHVQGRLDQDSIRQIETQPMPATAVSYLQTKISEIKEVSGNRDVNNGGSSASVTAASAIAALQEAGNGLSRDMIAASYRAFRRVVELIIELIRQFYTVPRQFRILGELGAEEYIRYSNENIRPRSMGTAFGVPMGFRTPVFDIEVEVQSESTYTKSAYNELAVKLYQLGIFAPEAAEDAQLLLELMDFKGKDQLSRKLQARAKAKKQEKAWQELALTLAGKYEPGLAAALTGQGSDPAVKARRQVDISSAEGKKENVYVARARQQAMEGSKPR